LKKKVCISTGHSLSSKKNINILKI